MSNAVKILVACFPKSGSSFLTRSLEKITGFRRLKLVRAFGNSEQELFEPHLLKQQAENGIVQLHCKATTSNLELIEKYEITPIVLTRNIFDVMVSLKDHFEREIGLTPALILPSNYQCLSDTEKLDVLVDLAAPWYVHFYTSWFAAKPGLWLTYEELFADQQSALARVLRFYGVPHGDIENGIREAETSGKTRFNQGTSGRGAMLSESQKNRIVSLTRHYPEVDFSLMGLTG